MTSRRKVYGASTSPRYRLKMFDYLSKGGRIPANIVMEAVDAMDEVRARNYGAYQGEVETTVLNYFKAYKVPNILRGIGRGLAFKFIKICRKYNIDDVSGRVEAMQKILQEHGLEGTVLADALLAYAGKEPTEEEGVATGGAERK